MLIPGIQQTQSFQWDDPRTMNARYLLYLPKAYDPNQPKRWPLILFLHGAGQRGNWLWLVKVTGLPRMFWPNLLHRRKDFPFIVVSPQCARNVWWSTDALNALLNEVVNKYMVDNERIYVTGLSMGGFATWSLAMKYPHRFAAIAPICGGGNPANVCAIKHLPVWTFHGARDKTVPIGQTENLVEALKKCGGNVRFTIYPRAGHDAWTETYANPELYTWFLKHTLMVPSS